MFRVSQKRAYHFRGPYNNQDCSILGLPPAIGKYMGFLRDLKDLVLVSQGWGMHEAHSLRIINGVSQT